MLHAMALCGRTTADLSEDTKVTSGFPKAVQNPTASLISSLQVKADLKEIDKQTRKK